MLKKVNKLIFDTSIIKEIDWENYRSLSSSYHSMNAMKELHSPYGGLPDSFNEWNTIIFQKFFNDNELDFKTLSEQTQMDIKTVSIIKQRPGNIIPLHIDTFYKLRKTFPNDKRMPVRANYFLEDWKLGHFIQFNDEVFTHWEELTGFIFNQDIPHLSANCGMQDKFTLQLSGFLDDY